MPEIGYKLEVQPPLEERQIRRLGAAVCLMWSTLPEDVQATLLDGAARILISGENIDADILRAKLREFVQTGLPVELLG